jgi:hypothetical protein
MRSVSCLGDSQSDAEGFGVHGFDQWPAALQASLRDAGYNVGCRQFGNSGDTTAQMLARVADCFIYARPDVSVVYGGVNDPGATISTAQTQANIQAIVKALKHRVVGDGLGSGPTVAGQANLPASGKLGDRYVVLTDTSTTGGRAGFDPAHHTTISGSVAADANGQKQTVWEFRYPAAGELGWGRIATNATAPLTKPDGSLLGCTYVVVCSTNYLNFTTGGDTLVTPFASYANVRSAQQAAVTAENGNGATVTYADLYTLQKGLIQSGAVPDFSAVGYDQTKSWHYKQDNQHHNKFGHALVAQVVRAGVLAGLT